MRTRTIDRKGELASAVFHQAGPRIAMFMNYNECGDLYVRSVTPAYGRQTRSNEAMKAKVKIGGKVLDYMDVERADRIRIFPAKDLDSHINKWLNSITKEFLTEHPDYIQYIPYSRSPNERNYIQEQYEDGVREHTKYHMFCRRRDFPDRNFLLHLNHHSREAMSSLIGPAPAPRAR